MRREPELNTAEQTLLTLVREGRVDAEIAVRLGLSTGEVRGRIAALASKLGVEGKKALQHWEGALSTEPDAAPRPRMSLRRGAFALLIVGIASFGGGLWMGRFTSSDGSHGDTVGASTAAIVSTPAVATPTPLSTRTPTTRTIDGSPSVDLGRLLIVPGHSLDGVATVDERRAVVVVSLVGDGLVQFNSQYLRQVRNGSSVYAESIIGSVPIAIFVWQVDRDSGVIPVENGEAVYSRTESRIRLMVIVNETRGVAQDSRGLRQYHATVDNSGELFVSTEPIGGSEVIDQSTGASLDVSGAQVLGVVASRLLSTSCDSMSRCAVGVVGGAFPAPANGQVGCDSAGRFEFVDFASGTRFTFEGFNGYTVPSCPAEPKVLIANDPIVGGYFIAHATDSHGHPLSLAVAEDGTMFAGAFAPTTGCPCVGHD
jgi:DNA-binding CsgD family transcriptional regulator